MPLTDFFMVLRWWGTLFFVGAAAYPLTKRLFPHWHDAGYFFAKAVGMAVVTWVVYILGIARVAPFSMGTIVMAVGVIFVLGIVLSSRPLSRDPQKNNAGFRVKPGMTLIVEELFFLAALLFWSWIKAHEPSIRGLEKFMDYGFMQSALRSTFFPPMDMWYPPLPVNYYYFGHLVTAMLTKLSGLDLAFTFNLMLATIFALCLTMSFSIGYQLSVISYQSSDRLKAESRRLIAVFGGLLTAFLVTLAGNMQTIYAFTQGYTGEDVKPFWELWWGVGEFFTRLSEGMNTYWYANATRFIPYTIHEFPSYSFVVSDVHGHVLSIPFVLLAIGLLITLFGSSVVSRQSSDSLKTESWKLKTISYGFLCGVLLMTNALDGPIYLGLCLIFLTMVHAPWRKDRWKRWGVEVGVVAITALVTSLPFLLQFKSFVNGLAVNCPLPFLSNSNVGPILFEGVEKCQRSPLWMMWLLWGFFWYCGGMLFIRKTKFTHTDKILFVFFVFSFALTIFPEFFYFKDIYPQHFRSNTMFKLGYQAFILWSIVSGYAIVRALRMKHTLFLFLLMPQLILVSIFPLFSVRSYFGGLTTYEGLYGLTWLMKEYPDDYQAMLWLRNQDVSHQSTLAPDSYYSLVEADGDSYTDYERFSVFTGIPTPIGWAVHEWLWRGSYDVVSPRREDVRIIYESEDVEETRSILEKYNVRYIIVGTIERQKFSVIAEWKFAQLARVVYQQNETVIYERIY